MIISTANAGFGREIIRATDQTMNLNWSYNAIHQQKTIKAGIYGADGKKYSVYLNAGDVEAINKAFERYSEHFK